MAVELAGRPRHRSDCDGVQRPCPFVGCRYNLFLEATIWGTLKYSRPGREPQDVPPGESCTLDVAGRGPQTLEEVGRLLGGLSRERVRQVEEACLAALDGLMGEWRGVA